MLTEAPLNVDIRNVGVRLELILAFLSPGPTSLATILARFPATDVPARLFLLVGRYNKPFSSYIVTFSVGTAVVVTTVFNFVAARDTREAFAVRAPVVVRVVVAVRATVPVPAEPVRADVARPEPPVARVAAARVAAVEPVVRAAVVDVVRDATPREFDVERGEEFVVVRAATTREEFAADARPFDDVAVVAVGIARPTVVRLVAFERVPDTTRAPETEGFVAFSFVSETKSVSSYS